jgi:hypothetical protein
MPNTYEGAVKVRVLRQGQENAVAYANVFEEVEGPDDVAKAVEEELHEGFIREGDVLDIAGDEYQLQRGKWEFLDDEEDDDADD